jgi:hypothetical protein
MVPEYFRAEPGVANWRRYFDEPGSVPEGIVEDRRWLWRRRLDWKGMFYSVFHEETVVAKRYTIEKSFWLRDIWHLQTAGFTAAAMGIGHMTVITSLAGFDGFNALRALSSSMAFCMPRFRWRNVGRRPAAMSRMAFDA